MILGLSSADGGMTAGDLHRTIHWLTACGLRVWARLIAKTYFFFYNNNKTEFLVYLDKYVTTTITSPLTLTGVVGALHYVHE